MRVLDVPAPRNASEAVMMASGMQTAINLAIEYAGFKSELRMPGLRQRTTCVPRVYLELTHPDCWTVQSNDPDHATKLEAIACDAAEQWWHDREETVS